MAIRTTSMYSSMRRCSGAASFLAAGGAFFLRGSLLSAVKQSRNVWRDNYVNWGRNPCWTFSLPTEISRKRTRKRSPSDSCFEIVSYLYVVSKEQLKSWICRIYYLLIGPLGMDSNHLLYMQTKPTLLRLQTRQVRTARFDTSDHKENTQSNRMGNLI